MHMTIDLGKEIAPVLGSRELVKVIESKITNGKVILDFKNVEFVTHSFAHELLKYKLKNPKIELRNMNSSVSQMFKVVEQQLQRKPKPPKVRIETRNIVSIIG